MSDLSNLEGRKMEKLTQEFQVDGEGLKFVNKVTMDVEPEAIDLIVDFD